MSIAMLVYWRALGNPLVGSEIMDGSMDYGSTCFFSAFFLWSVPPTPPKKKSLKTSTTYE